jgi:hypothetical protein
MDREQAMTLVLAEAFSENGLAMLAHEGDDPGWERISNLIAALGFLTDELADEDVFGREFVSALFALGNHVPELMRARSPDSPGFRPSLYEQAGELTIAVSALIENWSHWPDPKTHPLRTYEFETPAEATGESSRIERVADYALGDITYCVIARTTEFFAVRIARLGNGYLDVQLLGEPASAPAEFMEDDANRRFYFPALSPHSRFGGEDERLVNSQRASGPELRLLPVHYLTTTLNLIRERHAADPDHWPLPTGLLLERWFNQ